MEEINTTADVENTLRALGNDADAGRIDPDSPLESMPTTSGERAPGEAETADNDAPQADAEPENKTEAGSSETDSAGKEKEEEEKQPAEKPEKESKYTKAKKEAKRLDRSWKSLNEEKELFRAQREEWDKQRAEAAKAPAPAPAAAADPAATPAASPAAAEAPLRDNGGFSATDYESAASEFEKAGNPDLARIATEKAAALRSMAARETVQGRQQKFLSEWSRVVDDTIKEDPELGKKDAPIVQEVSRLLADEPAFSMFPDGFKKAVEVAKLRQDAGKVPELQAQVDKLNKEIERLNKLTSLGGSNPSIPAGPRKFDELSAADQEMEMRRMANQADSGLAA